MLSREEILKTIISLKKSQAVNKTDQLAALFLFILSNESIFEYYLIELNKKLASCLSAETLSSAPSHYLTIHSIKLPYPPNAQIAGTSRMRVALNRVLLEQEQKSGVNKGRTENTLPELIGQVPAKIAEELLNGSELWNDNNYDLTSFIHGEFSHRIQHYILTRYIQDHAGQLSDILPENKNAILKYLVPPFANERFYTAINYSRGYWNLVLDNDKDNPNANFIKREPNLTGPASLCEYLLSPASFKKFPYLTNCVYASMCTPIFQIATKMGASSATVFKLYGDSINQRQVTNRHFDLTLSGCMDTFKNDPSFLAFFGRGGYEGVKHLRVSALRNESTMNVGLFSENQTTALLTGFFEKYQVNPTGQAKNDLEKLLRTITANANPQDLKTFLEKFEVNINAKDNNPLSGKTALHLAIIKAYEKPERLDSYLECVKILLSKNASYQILDAQQKTADDYDKNNLFYLKASVANKPA